MYSNLITSAVSQLISVLDPPRQCAIVLRAGTGAVSLAFACQIVSCVCSCFLVFMDHTFSNAVWNAFTFLLLLFVSTEIVFTSKRENTDEYISVCVATPYLHLYPRAVLQWKSLQSESTSQSNSHRLPGGITFISITISLWCLTWTCAVDCVTFP